MLSRCYAAKDVPNNAGLLGGTGLVSLFAFVRQRLRQYFCCAEAVPGLYFTFVPRDVKTQNAQLTGPSGARSRILQPVHLAENRSLAGYCSVTDVASAEDAAVTASLYVLLGYSTP